MITNQRTPRAREGLFHIHSPECLLVQFGRYTVILPRWTSRATSMTGSIALRRAQAHGGAYSKEYACSGRQNRNISTTGSMLRFCRPLHASSWSKRPREPARGAARSNQSWRVARLGPAGGVSRYMAQTEQASTLGCECGIFSALGVRWLVITKSEIDGFIWPLNLLPVRQQRFAEGVAITKRRKHQEICRARPMRIALARAHLSRLGIRGSGPRDHPRAELVAPAQL